MKDGLLSLYCSRIQEEIRLHIQTIDLFLAVNALQSIRQKECVDTYKTRIISLLATLECNTSSFEFAKFVTRDEKIYNINLERQSKIKG